MAQSAILRGIEMPRVHAGGGCAVVTRRTRAKHLVVINADDWGPDIGAVAVLANIGCQRMQRTFAGRVGAVVTVYAITRDVRVIEIGRQPGNGGVAIIAVIATGYVSGVFSDR